MKWDPINQRFEPGVEMHFVETTPREAVDDECGHRRDAATVCTLDKGHAGAHVDAENFLAGQWNA